MAAMNRFRNPLLFVVFFAVVSGCEAPRFDSEDLCSIYQARPEWATATAAAEERWGVPQEVMMAVMRHESNFVGDAQAPRKRYFGLIPGGRLSSAYGYAQALDSTWEEYQQRTGNKGADRDEFEDAIDFVGWYLNRARRSLQIGRQDGYQLYLIYHEGHRGFLRRDYEKNPRLMAVAQRVDETRRRYRGQLRKCQSDQSEESGRSKREKRFSLKINDGKPTGNW